MAFDERGQADTVERKVEILGRAYDLVTTEAGFAPDDIILDPNILAVATGIEEHATYAKAFIDAIPRLSSAARARSSRGGVSNLSFAFRGNDAVREAMHASFLYHAIRAGLDMGIVNAGQLAVYEDIEPDLLERVEDVIFDRRPDATERMVEYADDGDGRGDRARVDLSWREAPVAGSARSRARARGRRLHRGGHGGGAERVGAAARRDRGAAHGRNEDRRRPVRLREDVPAAGREERARDEASAVAYLEPFMEAEKTRALVRGPASSWRP